MGALNTSNPTSLQVLMSEAIFDIGFPSVSSFMEQPETAAEPVSMLETFGKNNKNIIFIISDTNHQFFKQETELAFIKTLKALNLELDDVAVINHAKASGWRFDRIKDELKPKVCVFLGLDPQELGLSGCALNIWTEEESVQLLYSYSFDAMLTDVQSKREFWQAIKLISI